MATGGLSHFCLLPLRFASDLKMLFFFRVTIASHPEYRSWVEGYGIGYREVGGDPAALMKLSVEHKMFSPAFFRESLGKFRGWLDDLVRLWHSAARLDSTR